MDLTERDDGLLLDERVVEPLLEQFRPDGPSGPRAFQRKFVNVQDPLLPTNNLGRSVSKYSFTRMKRAMAHSALALRRAVQLVCIRCKAQTVCACYSHALMHCSRYCRIRVLPGTNMWEQLLPKTLTDAASTQLSW